MNIWGASLGATLPINGQKMKKSLFSGKRRLSRYRVIARAATNGEKSWLMIDTILAGRLAPALAM